MADAEPGAGASTSAGASPGASPCASPGADPTPRSASYSDRQHLPSADAPDPTVQSPPAPPENFNPPADFADSPVASISPPSGGLSAMSSSSSIASALAAASAAPALDFAEIRPKLQAIQRLSSESITPRSSQSSASVLSTGSEGGEHLAEMRERLFSEVSDGTASAGSASRRESDARDELEFNVITPTPPLVPVMEDAEGADRSADDAAHAWDSVWPVPNATHRVSLAPEASSSKFPLAPMSPYSTPAFSPAVVPLGRRPSSPPRLSPTRSPQERSRRESFDTVVSPTRTYGHQRSRSGVSPTRALRMEPGSPPRSPRIAYSDRPASPHLKRRGTVHGTPSRSSPPSSSAFGRARGKSVSIQPPVPPASPPRPDSPRPDLPRLTRRMSEASLPHRPSTGAVSPLPMALPPAVADAPSPMYATVFSDDGVASTLAPPPALAPLLAPVARPVIRRAFSEADSKPRPPPHRTASITAELDKSPKRPAEADDPHSPVPDSDRLHKSPRLPTMSPLNTSLNAAIYDSDDDDEPSHFEHASDDAASPWPAEDTADVFPTGVDVAMDVTFDDEGLNTLERIFLLSRSEYAFHRAYVARVLGDLLADVDPCESVEYVLPLVSGFSMDDDDTVKEAFAAELHRILWYFFSTCRLTVNDVALDELDEPADVVTITSEGVQVVPKPTVAEIASAAVVADRRKSIISLGPSSAGSALTRVASEAHADSPGSASTAASSSATAYSPGLTVDPFAPDDGDKGYTKQAGPLVEQPLLAVDFFRPLLGTMLLSDNPTIADPVRTGVIALIGRLRDQTPLLVETWGANASQAEPDERRLFVSQTGNHSHDLRPFSRAARQLVEHELLQGIVLGMGKLEVDVPDALFTPALQSSARDAFADDFASGRAEEQTEVQMFHAQMVHEARVGRALSLSFIGSVAEYYEPDEIVGWGFVDEVLRGWDGDDTTRAEAALAMSLIAKKAPVEHVERMVPLFEAFASDEADHVRQSACLALPSIARRMGSHDDRRDFVVGAVQTLAGGSDDVRCALLEMLGEVIHSFVDDPRGPPIETLQVYLDDDTAGPPDSDWDVIASFNFPGVCLTLGPDRWHELRPLFHRLLARAGDRVLATVSAFVHELARILRPDQVAADIVPVLRRCLLLSDEIRERVMEHVDVVVASVERDEGWALFKELEERWRDGTLGGWRVRERLALHIPAFLEAFAAAGDRASESPPARPHAVLRESSGTDVDTPRPGGGVATPVAPTPAETAAERETADRLDTMLELMRSALLDPFAAVRDAATNAVPRSYEILAAGSRGADKFKDIMLDLALSEKYRHRLVFVRCLREFVKPPPNRDAFEEFFVPALPRLSHDVVDVRLGLAQAIANLFVIGAFYSDRAVPVPSEIRSLAAILADDDAADVRATVRSFDVARLVKGKNSASSGVSDGAAAQIQQAQQAALAAETREVGALAERRHVDVGPGVALGADRDAATPSSSFAGRLADADDRAQSQSAFAAYTFPPAGAARPDAAHEHSPSALSPTSSGGPPRASPTEISPGTSASPPRPSEEAIAGFVPYHAASRPTPERRVTPGSIVEYAHPHVEARPGRKASLGVSAALGGMRLEPRGEPGSESEREPAQPATGSARAPVDEYGWEPRDAARPEWQDTQGARSPPPDASDAPGGGARPQPHRRGQSGEGKQDLWRKSEHMHHPGPGPQHGGLGGDAGGMRGGTRATSRELDAATEAAASHARSRPDSGGEAAQSGARTVDARWGAAPAPAEGRASVDSVRSDDSAVGEPRSGAERSAAIGPEPRDPFAASFARGAP